MKLKTLLQIVTFSVLYESAFAIDLTLQDPQDMSVAYDENTKSIFIVKPKSSVSENNDSKTELKEMRRDGSIVDLSGSFNPFPSGSRQANFFSVGEWNNELTATTADKTLSMSQSGLWVFKPGVFEEMKALCENQDSICKQAVFINSNAFFAGGKTLLLGLLDPANPIDTLRLFSFDSEQQVYQPLPNWMMNAIKEQFADFSITLKIDLASGTMLRAADQKIAVYKEGALQSEYTYTPTRSYDLEDFVNTDGGLIMLETDNTVIACPVPIETVRGLKRCNENKAFQVRVLSNPLLNQTSVASGARSVNKAISSRTVERVIFQGEYSGKQAPVLEKNGTLWVIRDGELHFYDPMAGTDTMHSTCAEQLRWAGMMPGLRANIPAGLRNVESSQTPWVVCNADLMSLNAFGGSAVEIQDNVPLSLEAAFVFPAREPIALLQHKNGIARFEGETKVTEYLRDIRAENTRLSEVWIEQGKLCGISSGQSFSPETNIACKAGDKLISAPHDGFRWPFAFVHSSFTLADKTYVLSKSKLKYEPQRYQIWELKHEREWFLLGESSENALSATLFDDGNQHMAVRIVEPGRLAVYRLKDSSFAKFFEAKLTAEKSSTYNNTFQPFFDENGLLYQACLEDENSGSLCVFDAKGTSTLVFKVSNNSYFDSAVSGSFGTLIGIYENGSYDLYLVRGKQIISLQDFLGELRPYAHLRPNLNRSTSGLVTASFEEINATGTRITSFVFDKNGIVQTFSREFGFGEARPSLSANSAKRVIWQGNLGSRWIRLSDSEEFKSYGTLEQALWATNDAATADLEIRGLSLPVASGNPKFFATDRGLISCPENQSFALDAARRGTSYATGCRLLIGLRDIDELATLQLSPRVRQIFLNRDGSIDLMTLTSNETAESDPQRLSNGKADENEEFTVKRISSGTSRSLSEGRLSGTSNGARFISWIEGASLQIRTAGFAKSLALPVPPEEVAAKSGLSLCTRSGVYELDEQDFEKWSLVDASPCLALATAQEENGTKRSAFLGQKGDVYYCAKAANACRQLNLGDLEGQLKISHLALSTSIGGSDTVIIAADNEIYAAQTDSESSGEVWTKVSPQYAYGPLLKQPVRTLQYGWLLSKAAAISVKNWLDPQTQLSVARFFAE